MDINYLINLFSNDSIEDYIKIIKICDELIASQKGNAAAYYFRAMAKMGVATSLELSNTLLLQGVPLGVSAGFGLRASFSNSQALRKKLNKIEEHYKIADSAVEDYNKAILLDKDVRKQYNIKIKAISELTGAVYYFYRPISSKETLDLLAGNKKYIVIGAGAAFLLILPFILSYFIEGDLFADNLSSTSIYIYISYGILLALYALFSNDKDKRILKKYDKDVVVFEKTNNNGWEMVK